MGLRVDCLVRVERRHDRREHSRAGAARDYPHLLADLKAQIRSAQWAATRVVNTALIELYWSIGKAILDRQSAEGWGTRVIDRLSEDLRAAYPDMRGLSRSNLHYMRQMAAAWPGSAVGPQPEGQLPWGHIRVLLDKLDEPDAMNWYGEAAAAGGWSRNAPEPDQGQRGIESAPPRPTSRSRCPARTPNWPRTGRQGPVRLRLPRAVRASRRARPRARSGGPTPSHPPRARHRLRLRGAAVPPRRWW